MDPRRLLPYLLGLAMCAVLVTGVVVLIEHRSPDTVQQGAPASAADTDTDAGSVLADWDARRARAWAEGDVAALRALYTAGSPTGRADAQMLGAYAERELRVEGLTTQVLALEVLDESADQLRVRVTDRVVGGVVAGADEPAVLPRDRPSTRTLTLQRVAGEWLMASVRDQAAHDQPRPAASTSRTSTSRKS